MHTYSKELSLTFVFLLIDKTPLERAALLERTPLFANIHAEMASEGQSAVPPNLDTDLHFTCFVRAPSAESRRSEVTGHDWRVIELDGSRDGPVDHGPCTDKDFLKVDFYLYSSFFLPSALK
jgi:ubiquitin carboxyl-terminal hydrolase L3